MKSDADYRREAMQMWRAATILAFVAFMAALFIKATSTPPGVYQRVVADCIMAGGEWERVYHSRNADRDLYGCVLGGAVLAINPRPPQE